MALWLVGEHHGQQIRHPLPEGEVAVGRGSTNDLVLPSQTVSRNHARLHVSGREIRVVDLGSLNGTRVDGRKVEGEPGLDARMGETVEFGSVRLRITDRTDPPTGPTPAWTDEHDISESIYLSRDEITDSHGKMAGADPAILSLLTRAGELLVLPESPEETFDRILELVEKTIPASRILILLRDEDGGDPIQRAGRIHGDRAISPLMLSRTMVHKVLEEGGALLTTDAQADQRFKDQQSVLAQDLHSAMVVPLIHHDETLGVLYVDTSDPLTTYSEHDLRILTLLGQMLGAKIANARLLEIARERERLQRELETAASIQERVLTQEMPRVDGYEIVAAQQTCDEVGGDLYDAGDLDNGRVQFCLGDVSGHGIGAALLMFSALATIRALRATELGPGDLVEKLDRQILKTTRPEHYLTLFLAELDPGSHRLQYVNAGHPPTYLLRPGEDIVELDSTGMPVGLLEMPEITFGEESVDFPPGSVLVVYSDGVSEAERGEEQFGDERFRKLLAENRDLSATELSDLILAQVEDHLDGRATTDDITLVILRRAGG